jgi:hypothetical protein
MTTQTPSPEHVARDYDLFARHFLKVMDKQDRLVPLRYNSMQRAYLSHRTRRDIILKARQIGFSTAIQAELFRYATTRPARMLTLANDDENTQKMRRMANRFYDNLPEAFRPVRGTSSATLTTYPGYGSEVMIATAGNTNSGRAGSYRYIHGSEVAFWKDAQSIVASALQGGNPQWIALESTPNGASGWFYQTCMEALDGNAAWRLHFFRWFDNPDYRLPLADGETLDYTGDELALIAAHSLTPEQIKWRRDKQSELKHLFQQEYPEDPHTCFLTSGVGFFSDIPDLDTRFRAPADAQPNGNRRCVAGLDFGQKHDYTALSIGDAVTLQEVALLRINQMSWGDMRARVLELCQKWNVTVLYPEANSMGSTNIEELHKEFRAAGLKTTIVPFDTTPASKPPLVTGFHYALDEGGLTLLPDPTGRQEIYTYTASQTPSGGWKYEGLPHDDTVVARMLMWLAIVQGRSTISVTVGKYA